MAGPTLRMRPVAAFIAVMLSTGCGSASSTPRAGAEESNRAPFTVYTHCGVENLRIDGQWWHAKPPVYGPERGGPPAGWGDPYQEGDLTIESDGRAVFEALGQRILFVPARPNEPVRVCR